MGLEFSALVLTDEESREFQEQLRVYLLDGRSKFVNRRLEFTASRRSGTQFPLELTIVPMKLRGGSVFSVFARDIGARKRAEEEKKQLRLRLQSMIDSMPSIIIGVEPDGQVIYWNKGAAEFGGLTAEDALDRQVFEVFPVVKPAEQDIRQAMRAGAPLRRERMPVMTPEDEMLYYDLMVYPLGASAGGAVIRLDEITNRVQIEEMMVQTEKMMSVGGLAAGMAHEINNPLGGILQAVQNIERRTSGDLAKNREVAEECGTTMEQVGAYLQKRGVLEFLKGIRDDGTRAAKIISDMLQYSRRSGSRFAPVPVVDLVDTVLRLATNDYDLKKQYDFRHVCIVKELDPALESIRCERIKIEQVLLNLIKNSAQAMAEDKVEGREPCIWIRTRREGDEAVIEVEDNGPGMPEHVRRRVFEPFFTTKEVGTGTGLGLSVSYFIVTKQHHGTMTVESAPGEGTWFTIRLPLVDGEHVKLPSAGDTN